MTKKTYFEGQQFGKYTCVNAEERIFQRPADKNNVIHSFKLTGRDHNWHDVRYITTNEKDGVILWQRDHEMGNYASLKALFLNEREHYDDLTSDEDVIGILGAYTRDSVSSFAEMFERKDIPFDMEDFRALLLITWHCFVCEDARQARRKK